MLIANNTQIRTNLAAITQKRVRTVSSFEKLLSKLHMRVNVGHFYVITYPRSIIQYLFVSTRLLAFVNIATRFDFDSIYFPQLFVFVFVLGNSRKFRSADLHELQRRVTKSRSLFFFSKFIPAQLLCLCICIYFPPNCHVSVASGHTRVRVTNVFQLFSIISVKAKSFADREIRYTLKAQGQGAAGTFNIGPTSGIVKLAKELDFEDLRQPHIYSLIVTATEDSGGFSTSVEVNWIYMFLWTLLSSTRNDNNFLLREKKYITAPRYICVYVRFFSLHLLNSTTSSVSQQC